MSSNFLARSRKWVGASALAILIGLGGGGAFLAASVPVATAQVTPAVEVNTPKINPALGFADLVDAVKPAVVSIIVEGRAPSGPQRMGREFNPGIPDLPRGFPFDFFDFGDPQSPRGDREAPQGRKFQGAGSGFVISADGYIVTNNHVVQNASKVTVIFDNGDERDATVLGTDERTDLAVVKVKDVSDLTFVTFADETPRVGDWVVAVGNPFDLGSTVTAGIVSALGRNVDNSPYGDYLQIDAAINRGNSGGPAFNLDGKVVGVNSAIFSPNGGNVGIAFAIPADIVKQVTTALIQDGVVTRGFLGVSIQDVTGDIADSVGLDEARGALVREVTEGSPGGKAGVRSGDIILAVDGAQIEDARLLSRTIAGKAPGSTVELTVWRDQAETKLTATLGTLEDEQSPNQPEQPDEPGQPTPSSVGITVVPNADGNGLLIQDVDPDSTAAEKGFAVGDAILEVDNKPVNTAQEFEDAIDAVKDSGRGTALIKAERNGVVRFLGLPLTDSND